MRLPFQKDPPRDARGAPGALPGAAASEDEALAAARTQARRRLIGALVLLAAGVVGFPLLFETQPRPLPADLPIVTAQRERAAPGRAPEPRAVPRSAPGVAQPAASPRAPGDAAPTMASAPAATSGAPAASEPQQPQAGGSAAQAAAARASGPPTAARMAASAASVDAAGAAAPRAASTATGGAATRGTPATTSAPAPAPALATAPTPAPARAQMPAPAPAPAAARSPEPPLAEGRFAVQVGAYSDAAMLRETRQKVDKLGLRTYTQVIEGDAGRRTRVRVGPFATREEAQAAAARLKAAGLPAHLLTL
jgi:DedD protein